MPEMERVPDHCGSCGAWEEISGVECVCPCHTWEYRRCECGGIRILKKWDLKGTELTVRSARCPDCRQQWRRLCHLTSKKHKGLECRRHWSHEPPCMLTDDKHHPFGQVFNNPKAQARWRARIGETKEIEGFLNRSLRWLLTEARSWPENHNITSLRMEDDDNPGDVEWIIMAVANPGLARVFHEWLEEDNLIPLAKPNVKWPRCPKCNALIESDDMGSHITAWCGATDGMFIIKLECPNKKCNWILEHEVSY